jgi:hypothetical protein
MGSGSGEGIGRVSIPYLQGYTVRIGTAVHVMVKGGRAEKGVGAR